MIKALRLPFKGSIEGFVVNYTKRNEWRLHGCVLVEDVLSDAYKIYAECLDRYAGVVDTPEWFMALFKRSFINYFHAVSSYSTFLNSVVSLDSLEEEGNALVDNLRGVDRNMGELALKLSQAPEEVQKVVSFMINNSESHNVFESLWRAQGKKKVGGNEYLCRALGYNHRKKDLVAMVYEYFIDEGGD